MKRLIWIELFRLRFGLNQLFFIQSLNLHFCNLIIFQSLGLCVKHHRFEWLYYGLCLVAVEQISIDLGLVTTVRVDFCKLRPLYILFWTITCVSFLLNRSYLHLPLHRFFFIETSLRKSTGWQQINLNFLVKSPNGLSLSELILLIHQVYRGVLSLFLLE